MNALEMIFQSKQLTNGKLIEHNSKKMDDSSSLFNKILKNEKDMTTPEISKTLAITEDDNKLSFNQDDQALTSEERVIDQLAGNASSIELNLQSELNEISPEIIQLVEDIITSLMTLTNKNDATESDSKQPSISLGTDIELSSEGKKIITSTKDYGLESDSIIRWHIEEPPLTNFRNESINLNDSREKPYQVENRLSSIITTNQNSGLESELSRIWDITAPFSEEMDLEAKNINKQFGKKLYLNHLSERTLVQNLQTLAEEEPNITAIQQQNQIIDSGQLLISGNPSNGLLNSIVKLIENVSPGTIVQKLPTHETENKASLIVDLSNLPEELAKQILQLSKILEKNNLENEKFDNKMMQAFTFLNDVAAVPRFLHNQSEAKAVQPLVNKADEPLEKLIGQVSSLLSQVKNEKDIPKLAPKLLELLQQWSALEKQNIKSSNHSISQATTGNEGSKEQLVWKDLVEVFQRRQDIAAKQMYNTDSNVTIQDVAKWLGKALEKQSHSDRALNQTIEFMPATTMQKLEQYTIHVNRSQTNDMLSTSQQVMEQFQSVIKSSKFLAMPNGTNQLSIALNPKNLGEMRLQLTQIDGEMTVKILVASQATKDILESNISQLKHMFSPHQVVIEKQEQVIQQNSEQMKDQKDQQMNQQEENNSNHQDQHEQHFADNEFETQFRELLNEKV